MNLYIFWLAKSQCENEIMMEQKIPPKFCHPYLNSLNCILFHRHHWMFSYIICILFHFRNQTCWWSNVQQMVNSRIWCQSLFQISWRCCEVLSAIAWPTTFCGWSENWSATENEKRWRRRRGRNKEGERKDIWVCLGSLNWYIILPCILHIDKLCMLLSSATPHLYFIFL